VTIAKIQKKQQQKVPTASQNIHATCGCTARRPGCITMLLDADVGSVTYKYAYVVYDDGGCDQRCGICASDTEQPSRLAVPISPKASHCSQHPLR
jgi:hypothetical protein